MRSKIQRLILNNLNTNREELQHVVWKWLSQNYSVVQKNANFLKQDDLYIAAAITKQNQFRTISQKRRVPSLYSHSNNWLAKPARYSRKFRRICVVTGRTRGVSRFFGLSRIQIKRAAKLRLVTGLRISSW